MAEEGRVHSYLAAKMLSMDFGERVEEADRLWNGTGKKHQENETGECLSEQGKQNLQCWGVSCCVC